MTGFAFDIKLCRELAFIFMSIVAGQTGHFAVGKAFAGSQHAVLIAVDIDLSTRSCRIGLKEIEQLVARLEAKGRFGL